MAYQALYRQYRPQKFSEVVGQKAIVATLRNSIINNRIAQAYLLCGPRGTGKTTIARIFAKAVNCENFDGEPCNNCANCNEITNGSHPDVIEIDAASNNSVDNIRDLIEKVRYAPIRGKYKVYIIDEVHMLSTGAFNALLKTLEEPPEHVIFILATTDPLKVPTTIISRCQRYNFGKINTNDLYEQLKKVAVDAKVNAEDKALKLIASLANGGMRDALSLLDQCISYAGNDLTTEKVIEIYGLLPNGDLVGLLKLISENDKETIFHTLKDYWEKGIDVKRLTEDMMVISKEALIYECVEDAGLLERLEVREAKDIDGWFTRNELVSLVSIFLEALTKYKTSENATSYFEVAVLKACNVKNEKESEPVKAVVAKPEIVREETSTNDKNLHPIHNVEEMKKTLDKLGVKEETNNVSRETITQVEEKEDINIDNETLLGILVCATKKEKAVDIANWKLLKSYENSLEFAKYARLLMDSYIVASSEDSLIVSVLTKGVANDVNQATDDESISAFVKEVIKKDKYLVAITKSEEVDLISLFRERKAAGSLPEAEVERKPVEVKNPTSQSNEIELGAGEVEPLETSTKDKLDSLFGENNYDIEDKEEKEN